MKVTIQLKEEDIDAIKVLRQEIINTLDSHANDFYSVTIEVTKDFKLKVLTAVKK